MSTIVPTLAHAISNIERFEQELDRSPELQRRLAFARAWYCHQTADGEWCFAPSKFAGYSAMTAEEYINDDPRDGRRTEKQLQTWFNTIRENDPIYDDLSERLAAFLGRYGKPPSSAVRINVTNAFLEAREAPDDASVQRNIADLMIAVGRSLPTLERDRIKAAL